MLSITTTHFRTHKYTVCATHKHTQILMVCHKPPAKLPNTHTPIQDTQQTEGSISPTPPPHPFIRIQKAAGPL